MAEENIAKPELVERLTKAVRTVIASNGVPYIRKTSVGSHSMSGRDHLGKVNRIVKDLMRRE